MQLKHIVRPLELKSLDADSGFFTGYGSVFGNIDSYGEIVVKGAFAKSLKETSPQKIKLLWQHQPANPIGVFHDISEDDHGLYVKGELLVNDVAQAREAYALLKAGAIDGLSIGFTINEGGTKRENNLLYLTDIKPWEISVVTFPANTLAQVQQIKTAQHITSIREFENFLRDVGFSRHQAKAIACHGFNQGMQINQWDAEDIDAELIEALKQLDQSITGAFHECRTKASH